MFSLQTIFGKGDKFYGLLEASAEAARESARAMHELVTRADRTPVMAAFSTARAREKALHGQISEELVNTFVTALDREDIEALSSALYKIPKTVEKFAERYVIVADRLVGIDFTPARGRCSSSSSEVVVEMIGQLRHGLQHRPGEEAQRPAAGARDRGRPADARSLSRPCMRRARSDCARSSPRTCSRLVEKAIDRCRDVGNVVYSIVLKNS